MWQRRDSNLRPSAYEAPALPLSYVAMWDFGQADPSAHGDYSLPVWLINLKGNESALAT